MVSAETDGSLLAPGNFGCVKWAWKHVSHYCLAVK